eukprot:3529696-Pleurochrysis_carterae.AAC.1
MEGLQLDRDIIKEVVKSVNTTIRQSLDVHSDHDVDSRRYEEEEEQNVWQTMQDELEGGNSWGDPTDYY